jgi:para-nitrobenzyl esterase
MAAVTEPVLAQTTHGALLGQRTADHPEVRAFLGVRFAPAQPVPAWDGERDATAFGPAAPQLASVRSNLFQGPVGDTSEDCLNLNVWTPDGERLPVLVWLHGGAFVHGAGSVPVLHGARLAADAGVVVVTLNHRLGALGFARHDLLNDETGLPPALTDVLAGLAWVRDNIAAFGGDPANVTLGGHSAGAMLAGLCSVLPEAADLFGKLVLHSGFPAVQDPDDAEDAVRTLAERHGVDIGTLRTVPVERIIAATAELGMGREFGPVAAGPLATPLPELQAAAPARPVLLSTSADEGTFYFLGERTDKPRVSEEAALAVLTGMFGPDAKAAYAEQPGRRPLDRAVAVITEHLFDRPAAAWAAGCTGPVTRVRHTHPVTVGEGWLGATHTAEIALLFGTFTDPALTALFDGDESAESAATALRTAWSAFLHTGALPADPGVEVV